jgi:hypothetical protein
MPQSPSPSTIRTLGQVGYEAYATHQGWRNAQGLLLPPWAEVWSDTRAAWERAASAIADVVAGIATLEDDPA